MKSIVYKCIYMLAILLLGSCYEDKGNYDYKTIPTVTISGIPDPCEAYAGTELKIPVTVSYSNNEVPKNVSYEWRVNGKVISTDKDLDILVDLDVKPGLYADFTVIDNDTQIRTIKTFKLNVSTEFATGWLILSNEANRSQLDYIRGDGYLYSDIYKTINQEDLGAGACQIKEHWLPWSSVNGEVFVGITQAPNYSVDLDGNSLKRMVYSKDEFLEGMPDNFHPTNLDCVMNWDYMISNGKLYTRYVKSGMDAKYHEGKFVRVPVPGNYELSDITFRGNIVFSNDVIAFDNLNKSYKLLRGGEMKDFNYKDDPNKKFNPSGMGKTLLAGGATSTATPTDNFIAFLKGDDGAVYVQKFRFSGWGNKSYSSQEEKIFPKPSLINSNTQWAICQGRPYAYFFSGNKLYAYNYNTDKADEAVKELKGVSFERNIRAIALNPISYEEMAVAVENKTDPSKSDFMLLDVSVVGDGQIKEGTYKEAAMPNVVKIAYKVGSQWNIPY